MKIAIYVAELDVKGGTHKQVLRLAEYLKRKGHSVQLVTPTFNLSSTYPDFAEFEVVSLYDSAPLTWYQRSIRRLAPIPLAIKLKRVDIVNIHDNRGLLFFFTAWILGRSRRYIWQINDLHPSFRIGNSAKVPSRWHHPITRYFTRLVAKMVDHIIVNVSKNAERVREHLGVDAEVLYCGVDMPTQLIQMPFPPTQPFRVLSTGVFFSFRNYERLIEACSVVRSNIGHAIELTIVGDTRYSPNYVKEIREIALALNVTLRIRENISQDELDSEIAANHVFAFVNIDQSWGLAVFETAARGRAVILSNSVGAAEILAGKPGFTMVNPMSVEQISKAIVDHIENPTKCRELGLAAASSVSEMTWDKMYSAKVEEIFFKYL